MRLVGMTVLIALMMAGCTTDDAEPSGDDVSVDSDVVLIDEEVAERRYNEVCQLVEGTGADRCADLVAAAISDAVDAGCSDFSLEAYFEHFATWSGTSEPGPDFFTRCPTPLSTMVLASPPEGFEAAGSAGAGTGSSTTVDVARDHVDAQGVRSWLEGLGHELSHRSVWHRRDDADVLMVRLDRFATGDGAAAFVEPDPGEGQDVEAEAVSGVLGGRIASSVLDGADVERPYRRVATGRVCEVSITLLAMGRDDHIELDLVREVFTQQARRAQVVSTC